MRLLIDTHCWLWWLAKPDRLGDRATALLCDRNSTVFFSAASSWELALKVASGKVTLPEPLDRYVPSRLAAQRMDPLSITAMRCT